MVDELAVSRELMHAAIAHVVLGGAGSGRAGRGPLGQLLSGHSELVPSASPAIPTTAATPTASCPPMRSCRTSSATRQGSNSRQAAKDLRSRTALSARRESRSAALPNTLLSSALSAHVHVAFAVNLAFALYGPEPAMLQALPCTLSARQ